MAACDNLYGNSEQWLELYYFLKATKPRYIVKWMRDRPIDDEPQRIYYTPPTQRWLINNCKLEWVQEELKDNFSIQMALCGKAHHEKSMSNISLDNLEHLIPPKMPSGCVFSGII